VKERINRTRTDDRQSSDRRLSSYIIGPAQGVDEVPNFG